MIGDLGDKLEQIGKLELLGLIAGKANAYYARRPVDGDLEAVRNRLKVTMSRGNILIESGDLSVAEAAYRRAIAMAKQAASIHPAEPSWSLELARFHSQLGSILTRRGDSERIASSRRRSLMRAHARIGVGYRQRPEGTLGLSFDAQGSARCREDVPTSHHLACFR